MLDVDTSLKVIRRQLKTEQNMITSLIFIGNGPHQEPIWWAPVRMDHCNKTMWCTKFQFVVTIYLNLHKKDHQAKHRVRTLCWFTYPKYKLNSDIEVSSFAGGWCRDQYYDLKTDIPKARHTSRCSMKVKNYFCLHATNAWKTGIRLLLLLLLYFCRNREKDNIWH